jgi:DNA-binding protein H-NS
LHQRLEDEDMRKPRNYDAELKALEGKAQELKARKVRELGELVIATGADALAPEELAGALIVLAETTDTGKKEAWAKRGAAFFRRSSRRTAPASEPNTDRSPAQPSSTQPPTGDTSTA